jgi:hypothetical protein
MPLAGDLPAQSVESLQGDVPLVLDRLAPLEFEEPLMLRAEAWEGRGLADAKSRHI